MGIAFKHGAWSNRISEDSLKAKTFRSPHLIAKVLHVTACENASLQSPASLIAIISLSSLILLSAFLWCFFFIIIFIYLDSSGGQMWFSEIL